MSRRYGLMGFTLIAAGAFAFFGISELNLSIQSSAQPEEISLEALLRRGEAGNPNIMLTGFTVCDDYIFQGKRARPSKVWMPIVPADAPNETKIRAFLFSDAIENENEVQKRFDRPKVRGMIDPIAAKPSIVGAILLKRKYPGTDTSRCIIIKEGKEPAGALKLGLLASGFVVCLALTGGIWYLAHVFDSIEVPPARNASSANDLKDEPLLDVLPADEPKA